MAHSPIVTNGGENGDELGPDGLTDLAALQLDMFFHRMIDPPKGQQHLCEKSHTCQLLGKQL